jgi:peroxiredoxin
MWKNITIIILLLAMVVWGVYDFEAKKQDAQKALAQTTTEQASTTSSNSQGGLALGNAAPDFTLQTVDGKNFKLSDLHGKKVLLNFFATWCPPCKGEMPDLESFYKEHMNDGITVLAVNLTTGETDPNTNIPKFISNFGLTFPVLLDKQGNIGDLYQAFDIPTSYFIDSKGVIRQKMVGAMNKDTMEKLISQLN